MNLSTRVQAGGTIYAITDRRAIIKHDSFGKHQTVSVPFKDMDAEFEIKETRPGVGHLYFASKMSTKLCYADYDGKLAFRELAKAKEIASLLTKIRDHRANLRGPPRAPPTMTAVPAARPCLRLFHRPDPQFAGSRPVWEPPGTPARPA